jgi:hypothetical protein
MADWRECFALEKASENPIDHQIKSYLFLFMESIIPTECQVDAGKSISRFTLTATNHHLMQCVAWEYSQVMIPLGKQI